MVLRLLFVVLFAFSSVARAECPPDSEGDCEGGCCIDED